MSRSHQQKLPYLGRYSVIHKVSKIVPTRPCRPLTLPLPNGVPQFKMSRTPRSHTAQPTAQNATPPFFPSYATLEVPSSVLCSTVSSRPELQITKCSICLGVSRTSFSYFQFCCNKEWERASVRGGFVRLVIIQPLSTYLPGWVRLSIYVPRESHSRVFTHAPSCISFIVHLHRSSPTITSSVVYKVKIKERRKKKASPSHSRPLSSSHIIILFSTFSSFLFYFV